VTVLASTANYLGLVGAFLSALGVALTLWGTRTTKTAFKRLRRILLGPENRENAIVVEEAVEVEEAFPGYFDFTPASGTWAADRWAEELARRIDDLRRLIVSHDHRRTEHSLKQIAAEAGRLRVDVEQKLDALDDEAREAERWNVAGLFLAFFGAILQGLALLT
jgi:hypothetical protein